MTEPAFHPPSNRECERCGRRDVWDEDTASWRIDGQDGDERAGRPFCIHEWDVDGTHNPFVIE